MGALGGRRTSCDTEANFDSDSLSFTCSLSISVLFGGGASDSGGSGGRASCWIGSSGLPGDADRSAGGATTGGEARILQDGSARRAGVHARLHLASAQGACPRRCQPNVTPSEPMGTSAKAYDK